MHNPNEQQNLLYFYDLPKDKVTSVQLAKLIKEKTGIELSVPAQFKKDIGRYFDSAIVKIDKVESNEKFKEASQKLKYFEIDGAQCRALPFDKDILGQNKLKLIDRNVFVKKLPANMTAKELDEYFTKWGPIKSAKISIDKDYKSNGYGFVCFEKAEDAARAIEDTKDQDEVQAIKFMPKEKKDLQKMYNNLYVKNFPQEYTEQDVRQVFQKYGDLLSVVVGKNEHGAFAFVCYGKQGAPRDYGYNCAQNAVKDLHGKPIDETHMWYVKPALNKQDREIEKKKDMIRYKNSKKRCNLYVKNFPPTTTVDQLKELFGKYGEIESIKIFPKEGEAVYAFVCFKTPEAASTAKSALHQQPFNGKQLYINHYEIKEIRKAQYEEMHDKSDFQNYKKQNTNISELMSKPEIFAILNQLIALIQPKLNLQQKQQRMNRMGQGQRPPNTMGKPYGQMPQQQMMGQPPMPQTMPQNMPPTMMPNPQVSAPMAMQQRQPQQMMPPMMMPQQQMMPGNQMFNIQQQYLAKAYQILPACHPQNPNYKNQVGEVIYEFVEKIAGEDKAPKITGMLIDLPIEEMQGYLQNYAKLEEKVREANNLLQ